MLGWLRMTSDRTFVQACSCCPLHSTSTTLSSNFHPKSSLTCFWSFRFRHPTPLFILWSSSLTMFTRTRWIWARTEDVNRNLAPLAWCSLQTTHGDTGGTSAAFCPAKLWEHSYPWSLGDGPMPSKSPRSLTTTIDESIWSDGEGVVEGKEFSSYWPIGD